MRGWGVFWGVGAFFGVLRVLGGVFWGRFGGCFLQPLPTQRDFGRGQRALGTKGCDTTEGVCDTTGGGAV